MYRIYADNVCIHSDISPDYSFKAISPKLTLEVNSAGTLTFSLTPENAGYNTVQKLITKIVVYKDEDNTLEEIWEGRVISEQQDFWNNRVITCEGEMAYLNDTVQPQIVFDKNNKKTITQLLDTIIENHNGKASSDKQFTRGTIAAGTDTAREWEFDYDCTMNYLTGLVDEYEGIFRVRKAGSTRYLDYIDVDKQSKKLNEAGNPIYVGSSSAMTDQNKIYIYTGNELGYRHGAEYYHDGSKWVTTQRIEFGSNLLDFTRDWDLTDYATVILPTGANLDSGPSENLKEHLTVEGLTDAQVEGKYVKNLEAVENYGWIAKRIDFNDIGPGDGVSESEAKQALLERSKLYLTNYQFDNMTVEVKAVDLHLLDQEKYESIKLFDHVHVISVPHGLDRWFPVTKVEITLDKPDDTTYTLSKVVRQKISDITVKYYRNA